MKLKLDTMDPVLDALTSSLAIIDETGIIVTVNRAWRDFAKANHPNPGLVCEGADYLRACDSARGDDAVQAAEFAAALRAMLRSERGSFSMEYPCHSPTEKRWFCARVALFRRDGASGGVITHETITERILAELELRNSERQYRELFENSVLAISETSLEGRLVRANLAYAHLYGYEGTAEMIAEIGDVGQQLYVCPEERQEVLGILAAKGVMEPREIRVRRRDGSVICALVSARVLLDAAGRLRGYQANHLDISAQKEIEAKLRAAHEQMRALASRVQAATEQERTKIARKIHDLLSQTLTRLKIDLVWLQRRLENPGETFSAKTLGPRVAEMIGMADEAVSTVQRIATELRPAVLDSLGLCAALEWLARDFRDHADIGCRALVPEGELRIDTDVATAAFRIAQESLANAVRHSRATEVEIHLEEKEGQLILSIHDNGIGIDSRKLRDPLSIGLAGMRERALLLGGNLDIRSMPASGAIVEARFPLERPDRCPEGEP
jgi:PAS domain S-box-containing protein